MDSAEGAVLAGLAETLPLRVAGIFIIAAVSLLGVFLPVTVRGAGRIRDVHLPYGALMWACACVPVGRCEARACHCTSRAASARAS